MTLGFFIGQDLKELVVAFSAVRSIPAGRVNATIDIGGVMDACQVGLVHSCGIGNIGQRKAHFGAVLIHVDDFPIGPC